MGAVSARSAREGITLRTASLGEPRISAALSEDEVDRALDPMHFLGSTYVLIDRALAAYRSVT